MSSQVPLISREQLEALPTRAVLARLVSLRRCEQSPEESDLSAEELAQVAPIRFKSTPEWRTAVDDANQGRACDAREPAVGTGT